MALRARRASGVRFARALRCHLHEKARGKKHEARWLAAERARCGKGIGQLYFVVASALRSTAVLLAITGSPRSWFNAC